MIATNGQTSTCRNV